MKTHDRTRTQRIAAICQRSPAQTACAIQFLAPSRSSYRNHRGTNTSQSTQPPSSTLLVGSSVCLKKFDSEDSNVRQPAQIRRESIFKGTQKRRIVKPDKFSNLIFKVSQRSIPSNKSRSIREGGVVGIARINVSLLPSQRWNHLTGPLKPPSWLA